MTVMECHICSKIIEKKSNAQKYCSDCTKIKEQAYARQYRAKHKEAVNANQRKWYKENKYGKKKIVFFECSECHKVLPKTGHSQKRCKPCAVSYNRMNCRLAHHKDAKYVSPEMQRRDRRLINECKKIAEACGC